MIAKPRGKGGCAGEESSVGAGEKGREKDMSRPSWFEETSPAVGTMGMEGSLVWTSLKELEAAKEVAIQQHDGGKTIYNRLRTPYLTLLF